MRRIPPAVAAAVLLAAVLMAALGARAAPDSAPQSFERFCASWMTKLDDRERHNLATARVQQGGAGFYVDYTGYADKPIRCEASAVGASRAVVGKLVYRELRVRRSASTRAATRQSTPQVLRQVEVMEIFRHDGQRWVY